LVGQTACPSNRFEPIADLFGIILLTNTDGADDYDGMFRINAVNHTMISKLMFPIIGQRAAQWQSVTVGLDRQLFPQSLSELIADASVKTSNVGRRIRSVSNYRRGVSGA
jgi:hypothetical protein